MYLAYLDESGNTGRRLDDPDQPIHWLIGVLVPEERAIDLARDLDAAVVAHVPDDPDRELHGSELFGGDRRWAGVLPATRFAIYESALTLLTKHECAVVHASIDKQRLTRWNLDAAPHLLALHFVVEKIDRFVAGQSDALRPRALLVADETHEHEAFAIDLLRDLQRRGVGVFSGHVVENVVDTVHFVRSETNRGVQLADLVAYALARNEKVGPSPHRFGDRELRRLLEGEIMPVTRTWRERWPRQ